MPCHTNVEDKYKSQKLVQSCVHATTTKMHKMQYLFGMLLKRDLKMIALILSMLFIYNAAKLARF